MIQSNRDEEIVKINGKKVRWGKFKDDWTKKPEGDSCVFVLDKDDREKERTVHWSKREGFQEQEPCKDEFQRFINAHNSKLEPQVLVRDMEDFESFMLGELGGLQVLKMLKKKKFDIDRVYDIQRPLLAEEQMNTAANFNLLSAQTDEQFKQIL